VKAAPSAVVNDSDKFKKRVEEGRAKLAREKYALNKLVQDDLIELKEKAKQSMQE